MAIISTPAIVLRAMDYRETSKLAFLFTQKCGKMIGVLKGIRKSPKKFGSSADKFSINDVVIYQYSNRDIHLVSQCDMKEHFPLIREDAKKITAAEYASELLNKIMPLEEPNPRIYHLYYHFLKSLGTEKDVSRLVHMFQIKVLALSGFRPHIDSCVSCRKEVVGRVRFSMSKGGLVCPHCRISDHELHMISAGTVSSLLYVENHDWKDCLKLKMPGSIQKELKYLLNNFLIYHLGKNIKSSRYL